MISVLVPTTLWTPKVIVLVMNENSGSTTRHPSALVTGWLEWRAEDNMCGKDAGPRQWSSTASGHCSPPGPQSPNGWGTQCFLSWSLCSTPICIGCLNIFELNGIMSRGWNLKGNIPFFIANLTTLRSTAHIIFIDRWLGARLSCWLWKMAAHCLGWGLQCVCHLPGTWSVHWRMEMIV